MDVDDPDMNNDLIRDTIVQMDEAYPRAKVEYAYREHTGPIHALNAGLLGREFDMVMGITDGFMPCVANYDELIVKSMIASWPDMNGAIYFNDGECGERFALAPILGRRVIVEQGWFFDPYYIAGGADRALSAELRARDKLTYFSQIAFQHTDIYHLKDKIFHRNKGQCKIDRARFRQRRRQGYYERETASAR